MLAREELVREKSIRQQIGAKTNTTHADTQAHAHARAVFIFRGHLLMETVDWPTEARSGRVYRKLKPNTALDVVRRCR